MLTYALCAVLRLPKAPRQEDSILSPTTDIEGWLIGISFNRKAILRGVAFFRSGLLLVLSAS